MSGLISSLLTLGPVFILEYYHQSSSEEKEREPFTEHPPHAKSQSRCFISWLRKYSSLSTPLALVAFSLMSVLHPWVLTKLTYPSVSLDISLPWRFSKHLKLNLPKHSFIYNLPAPSSPYVVSDSSTQGHKSETLSQRWFPPSLHLGPLPPLGQATIMSNLLSLLSFLPCPLQFFLQASASDLLKTNQIMTLPFLKLPNGFPTHLE